MTKYLLIGGDFSGIQSYIYQIVSKFAAKNLKGRSFYVSLLGKAVTHALCKRLGSDCDVVYSSGGTFYLTVPDTLDVRDKLDKAIEWIEDRMYDSHGTSLFVAIDYVELPSLEVGGNELSEIWGQLFRKRDRKKTARLATQMTQDYERFFTPRNVTTDKCDAITGEPFDTGDQPKSKPDVGYLTELNYAQIKLGEVLKDCHWIVEADVPDDDLREISIDTMSIEPAGLGVTYYFIDDENKAKEVKKQCHGVRIEEYHGASWNNGDFTKLCETDGDNYERLGVLRMDVDNLGALFQKGVKVPSLSNYKELSNKLNRFFAERLDEADLKSVSEICKSISEDRLFVVYAGGDDLFIVGDWIKVIEAAKEIRKKFVGNYAPRELRQLVKQDYKFGISGGMALVKTKYPIVSGAELSADEEDRAKHHATPKSEKDSFSFMGMPLSWEHEFDIVEELKVELLRLLSNGSLTKSFLSKVMSHAALAQFKGHKVTNVKAFWMLSYDLSRYAESTGKDKDAKKELVKNSCGIALNFYK